MVGAVVHPGEFMLFCAGLTAEVDWVAIHINIQEHGPTEIVLQRVDCRTIWVDLPSPDLKEFWVHAIDPRTHNV